MVKKKFAVIVAAICAVLAFCGANWFDSAKVTIDTEKNRIYQYHTIDEVGAEFAADEDTAKEKYLGAYVLLSGKIAKIEKDGKSMEVSGLTDTAQTIQCSIDKSLRPIALEHKVNDSVAIYGKLSVGLFDKKVRLNVEKIVQVPTVIKSDEVYFLLDGTVFDKTDAEKVTLDEGNIAYYIPRIWTGEEIQHNIVEEELGIIEGYQYVLNKIPGSSDTIPESLFVCYFDNQKLLADYQNDSDETELIEKAIVANILGEVKNFPTKEVKTYYGAEYTYYAGVFKNALETGTGYHAEFIFQKDGEDGIVMFLYVYKDTKHLGEVLFLSRFLEIGEKYSL